MSLKLGHIWWWHLHVLSSTAPKLTPLTLGPVHLCLKSSSVQNHWLRGIASLRWWRLPILRKLLSWWGVLAGCSYRNLVESTDWFHTCLKLLDCLWVILPGPLGGWIGTTNPIKPRRNGLNQGFHLCFWNPEVTQQPHTDNRNLLIETADLSS